MLQQKEWLTKLAKFACKREGRAMVRRVEERPLDYKFLISLIVDGVEMKPIPITYDDLERMNPSEIIQYVRDGIELLRESK